MSQKTIQSYFKITPSKRAATSDANDSSPSKRNKSLNGNAAAGDKKETAEKQETEGSEDLIVTEIKKQARTTPALHENIGHSWYIALREEFRKGYFVSLSAFLDGERKTTTIYPPADKVFSWTHHCPIRKVKVVILGQDPYHGPNQAHGLSFSVCRGVDRPPSLRNIFKELETDIKGFRAPSHSDLTGWAEQGVLLLNTCLTVKAGNANSHANRGWEKLTDSVIKWLGSNCSCLVFLLWGNPAQKKAELIDAKKHLILKAAHPSPLSASRGFFGCKHFSKANSYLEEKGKTPIDWKLLN